MDQSKLLTARLASGRRAELGAGRARCSHGTRRSATSRPRSSAPSSSSDGGLAIWNGSWYGGHYTAHLQRPLPAARRAARPAGGRGAGGDRLRLPLRPPRPRPLGGRRALGDPLVRGRRRHPARRRPAHLRPRRRLRPRLPARRCRWGAPRRRSPSRRRARSPARSPPSSSPASWSPARSTSLDRERRPRSSTAPIRSPALAFGLVLIPNLAFPARASSRSSSPPSSRSRSGAGRRCSSPAGSRGEERQLRQVLLGYVLASTAGLAAAQRDGRQRGAARRPVRRPGPGRGTARPPAAGAVLVRRTLPRRQPLLADERERHPDRAQRRRPVDHGRVLRPASRTGCAATAGPASGSRCRRPPTTGSRPIWRPRSTSRAAGCASSTRRATTSSTTTGELGSGQLPRLAARQRDQLRRPARRAARLLLGGGAAADPERTALPAACAGSAPDWRVYAVRDPEPLVEPRRGRGGARPPGRPPGLRPRRDPTRGSFLVRVNFTPYWSIARGSGCLLRRGDWTLVRADGPGVFRVGADFSLCARLERGHRRPQDLLRRRPRLPLGPVDARQSARAAALRAGSAPGRGIRRPRRRRGCGGRRRG